MATHGTKHLQLRARSGHTRMVYLINLYGHTVGCASFGIISNVQFKTSEHAHQRVFIGHQMSVNPYIGSIINAMQG